MKLDLDSLRTEIADHLKTSQFVVFPGLSRLLDSVPAVFWDVDQHPEYREFLSVAEALGAKLVVFHQREFTSDHIDDALSRLENARMPREQQRSTDRRLREMRAYEGFTCALELSFEHQGRLYMFDLRSDWYEELADLLDEIDAATPDDDEDDEPMAGGSYFSRN